MNTPDPLADLRETIERVRALATEMGVAPGFVTVRHYGARYPALTRADFTAARAELVKEEQAKRPHQPLIPPGHALRGVSTLIDAQGNITAQWQKTADARTREEIIADLVEELPKMITPRRGKIKLAPGPLRADLMAVYPLGDPHVGMLAWAKETGADFDLKIAEDLMVRAMADLVLRGPRAERALIANLGDFFHADNVDNHTTKGTHTLDVDGRTSRVLGVGVAIMGALIDAALEHHAHVTVDNRIGNHDAYTAVWLALAMRERYRNDPRVEVPIPDAHRAYYEFGRNMIGITHGDRAKGEALGPVMATERPEMWGRTRHRYWYTGHVHHQAQKEYRGVRVESFRTLAARDSWHAAQGYVSGRDMHRITLHREHGEVGREIVNVCSLLEGME